MNLYESSSESEAEGRKPRRFLQRINFWEVTDPQQFLEKFRLNAEALEYVLLKIGDKLQHTTARNFALTPKQQIMIACHWLGNGSQYHALGDAHGIHKSTVTRCVRRVTDAVVEVIFPKVVRWPTENITAIPTKFMKFAGFPQVAGCVDGSLIPIDAPRDNEAAFVDRKGGHSINAMVVSGPNLEFFYASARWPGSVHDSRILRNSTLYERWETDRYRPFPGAIILGDSGYGLSDWLLTPIERAGMDPTAMTRYLRSHKSTRRTVECALGGLKEKFPCLSRLRLKTPERCGKVVLACVALYNVQKSFTTDDVVLPAENNEDMNEETNNQDEVEPPSSVSTATYERIVRSFSR